MAGPWEAFKSSVGGLAPWDLFKEEPAPQVDSGLDLENEPPAPEPKYPEGMTGVRAKKAGARVTVGQDYADRFQGLFDDLEAAGYGIDPEQTGGYNPRNIIIDGRDTGKPSKHGLGKAIDVNWTRNAEGGMGDIPPELARELAGKHGLRWGGDFKGRSPDPMHFEVDDEWAPPAQVAGAPGMMMLGAGDTRPPWEQFQSPEPITPPKSEAAPWEQFGAPTTAKPETKTPEEPSSPWAMPQGFTAGIIGSNPKMFGDAADGVGVLLDKPGMRDFGRQISKASEKRLEDYKARVPGIEDVRTDSVWHAMADFGAFAGYSGGNAIATSMPSLVTGGAATLMTGNPMVGMILGGAVPSATQNFGDVWGSMRDNEGIRKRVEAGEVSEKWLATVSLGATIPIAMLDVYSLGSIASKATGADQMKKTIMRDIAHGIAVGSITEGSTEGVQEIISQAVQQAMGSNTTARDATLSVVNNFFGGVFGGGMIGGGEAAATYPGQVSRARRGISGLREVGFEAQPGDRDYEAPMMQSARTSAAGAQPEPVGAPQSPIPPPPGEPPPEQPPGAPPAPPATPADDEAGLLRGRGWTDDQIEEMDPAERAAEAEDARAQGVRPIGVAPTQAPDTPSAEPMVDIMAQARDLKDPENPRQALYLPKPTLDGLDRDAAQRVLKSGVAVQNFDGKGGALVARNRATLTKALARRDAGEDMQAILGELTGAGQGKPVDGNTVVQQVDADGAVTRETLAAPGDVAKAMKDLAADGRTVRVVTPQGAIQRREQAIQAEAVPVAPVGAVSPSVPVEAGSISEGPWTQFQTIEPPAPPEPSVWVRAADGQRVRLSDISQGGDTAAIAAPGDYTPDQGEAGNRKMGHTKWNGLDISIETDAENVRRGRDKKSGEPWSSKMGAPYGYFKGTEGNDGMHVDVFVGPQPELGHAYVIDEVDNKTGKFRQHKVMIGFASEDDAVEAYTGSGNKSLDGVGAVTEMPAAELKAWLGKGKRTKPLGDISEPARAKRVTAGPREAYDGPELTDDEVNLIVDSWKYVREVDVRGKPQSLAAYVIAGGGLRDDVREVRHIAGAAKERPGLVNKDGQKLDDAARRAWEAGFMPGERPTVAEFLDALQDDLHTGNVVREQDQTALEDVAVADEMARELEDYGVQTAQFRTEEGLRRWLGQAVAKPERAPGEKAARGSQGAKEAQAPQITTEKSGQTSLVPEPTTKEQIAAAAKAKGKKGGAEPMDVGMFGSDKEQGDLVDAARAAKSESPIVQFRKDAAEIEAELPPVPADHTRLWRGNRPGEIGKNPSFTNDLPGIALPFRKAYGGDLSYVDVLSSDLSKYEDKVGSAPGAEFHLPKDLASKAVKVGGEPVDPLTAIRDRLMDKGFASITDARKFAKEVGFEGTVKEVDELVERAAVAAAREIVQSGSAPAQVYDALVSLYEAQPNLNVRTSESVSKQAYSTPLPLAYVASRLAGVAKADVVYEPTAGNGALLIEAGPGNDTVYANELDAARAAALKEQGFQVSERDATKAVKLGEKADAIIMNPPFGAVREGGESKVWTVDGLKTTAVDHAIALTALEHLTPTGKAVLILGGVKAESVEELRKGYRGQAKREFYWKLYNNFNVVAHFQVKGDLYEKQGAGWPVDVVVIHGRGKSALSLPAASPPAIVSSWDALKEKLPDAGNARRDAKEARSDRRPRGEPVEGVAGSVPGDAGSAKPASRSGAERPASRPADESAPVRGERVRGEPGDVRKGAGDADRVLPGAAAKPGRTDQPTPAERERLTKEERAPNATGQSRYETSSSVASLGSLVPANMADSSRTAIENVVKRHGPVDAFVMKELGYRDKAALAKAFSAEQVDAIAAAIDNVKRGAAFILGDQTGIGKGRVVAAMLRYAMRNSMVPMMVTEKPDLYGDMFRDLRDVGVPDMLGRDMRMFMTNTGETVPLDEEALTWKQEVDAARAAGTKAPKQRGQFLRGGGKAKQTTDMGAIRAWSGKGEAPFDVVFTTYDQMNTVKGGETERRGFISALAPNALIVMDESHNAGGQGQKGWKSKDAAPNRAEFARDLVAAAKAVMYSSATYAKRPDVMDLYARTDMGKAVDDPKLLPELIAKGGVPMQQVVASMLAGSGQYMRREKSFEGINYDVVGVPVDAASYKQFSDSIRAVFRFDLAVAGERAEIMKGLLDEMGSAQTKDSGVGEAAASATHFASIMHNIVAQMLLSIKAGPTADRAIAAAKAGKKPVIGLSNTMEAFISDFASAEGLEVGDAIDLDFGDVLARYLARTLRITVKDGEGKRSHIVIPLERLPTDLQRIYEDARALIAEGDYKGLPVSPVDFIRHKLAKAGLLNAEITGRQLIVDYSQNPPVLARRAKKEMGPTGKRSSIAAFNAGKLDVLVINRSGSTGVSLHAKSDFKDKRPRRMLLAQAEANIDTHLQMLGRINRTGQVVLPDYEQIAAEIPAEARPTAVLMRKMASLNANTTGARNSVFMADSVDFMNQYGDEVVADVVLSYTHLNRNLGNPIKITDMGVHTEGAARRVTGRLVLLEPKEQAALLDEIQTAYKAEIERVTALGENALEAKSVDLQARTVETQVLKEAQGDGPFLAASNMEKVSAKAQGRAMKPSDVAKEIAHAIEAEVAEFGALEAKGRAWAAAKVNDVKERSTEAIKREVDELSAEAQIGARQRLEANLARWMATARIAYPGARVVFSVPSGEMEGIVTKVERSGKAKNPAALSAWHVTIAVPDAMRQITFPFSKLFPEGTVKSDDEKGSTLAAGQTPFAELEAKFEEARKEGRETRFLVTGNILAGYDQVGGRGQIVNYTTESGETRPGILMPRDFDFGHFMDTRAIRFTSGAQVADFIGLSSDGVHSTDKIVRVSREGDTWFIKMPASRNMGGRYYTEPSVRDAIRPAEFVKHGNEMRAELSSRTAFVKALDAMRKVGALFETRTNQEMATQVIQKAAAEERLPFRALKANIRTGLFMRSRLERAIAKRRPWSQKATADKLRAALVNEPNIFPSNLREAVVERIEPFGTGDDYKIIARDLNGEEIEFYDRGSEIPGTSGLFSLLPDGTPISTLFALESGGVLTQRVKSVRAHEGVHALRMLGYLPGSRADLSSLWGRLSSHADDLNVLGLTMREFGRRVDHPRAERFSDIITVFENYHDIYRDFRPTERLEAMVQEAVASMLELYVYGKLSDEQMAPVKDLVDAILSGEMARGEPSEQANRFGRALDPRRASLRELAAPEVDALGFISTALEAVKQIPQGKGTVEQMRSMAVRLGGAGTDKELAAIGFDKAYPDPKAMITRQAFEDFVRANRLVLGKVVRGQKGVERQDWETAYTGTDHSNWSTPGGVDGSYQEVVTTLPRKALPIEEYLAAYRKQHPKSEESDEFVRALYRTANEQGTEEHEAPLYTSTHWPGIANPLWHGRYKLFDNGDGTFTLVSDERQSDWAQRARDQGTRDPAAAETLALRRSELEAERKVLDAEKKKLDADTVDYDRANRGKIKDLSPDLHARSDALNQRYRTNNDATMDVTNKLDAAKNGVPSAPFIGSTSDWVDASIMQELAMIARDPAYAKVTRFAWAPGTAQNERYNKTLRNVKALAYEPEVQSLYAKYDTQFYDKNNWLSVRSNVTPKKLAEIVGKQAAESLLAAPRSQVLRGQGLTGSYHAIEFPTGMELGGEPMRQFYGDFAEDGTFKPGIVGTRLTKIVRALDSAAAKIEATEVGRNIEMFREGGRYGFRDRDTGNLEGPALGSKTEAEEHFKKYAKQRYPSIPITPALRAAVLRGLPLFGGLDRASGVKFSRIGQDPNRITWNGQQVWALVVEEDTGKILHGVTYEEAQDGDFHHTFYVPRQFLDRVNNGKARVVWADARGLQSMGEFPADLKQAVADQVTVKRDAKFSRIPFRGKATPIEDIGPDDPHPGPVLAYHGTTANFETFDLSKQKQAFGIHIGSAPQANQFTITHVSVDYNSALKAMHDAKAKGVSEAESDKVYADNLAAQRAAGDEATGGRIFPVVLDVTNPLTINHDFGEWRWFDIATEVGPALYKAAQDINARDGEAAANAFVQQELEARGYDAIRYPNKHEGGGWSYIAWKKGTVHSATAGETLFSSLQLTGPARETLRSDMQDALDVIQRIAGTKVKVQFRDQISDAEFMETAAPETVGGFYTKPGILDPRAVIGIALKDPQFDPESTAGHEAFHHVMDTLATPAELRLMRSPGEQARMRKLIKRARPELQEIDTLPDYEVETVAFQEYRRMAAAGAGDVSGLHIAIRKLFDRIIRFLAMVENMLRGLGTADMRTYEDVFEAADAGIFAAREADLIEARDEIISIIRQERDNGQVGTRVDRAPRGAAGEGSPEGRPAPQGSDTGGRQGARPISSKLYHYASDLLGVFNPKDIAARREAQGFTTDAWHGGKRLPSQITAFGRHDFGYHVAIGRPNAANEILGFPANFLDGIAKGMFAQRDQNHSMILPLKVRYRNALRFPDLTRWRTPFDWLQAFDAVWLKQYGRTFDPTQPGMRELKVWLYQSMDAAETGSGVTEYRASLAWFQEQLTAKLEELGYDAVIYTNKSEDIGSDSLLLWKPENVRSANDVFDPRADGHPDLLASLPYIEFDIRAALNALAEEEGIADEVRFSRLGGANPDDVWKTLISKPVRTVDDITISIEGDENGPATYVAHKSGRQVGSFRIRLMSLNTVSVTNAKIPAAANRRQGVATRVYDTIQEDLAALGYKLIPQGIDEAQMSEDAYQFWLNRDPQAIIDASHDMYQFKTETSQARVREAQAKIADVKFSRAPEKPGSRETSAPAGVEKVTQPLRAWHVSGADFDTFDPAFSGKAWETGGGVGAATYPGGFSFTSGRPGPDSAKWIGGWQKDKGQAHIYEVNVHVDHNLTPDLSKTFSEQTPAVQKILLDNEKIIRESWTSAYPRSTFNGQPWDQANPAHWAAARLDASKDRAVAIASLEDETAAAQTRRDRNFYRQAADVLKSRREPQRDLFNPNVSIAAQYGMTNWGFPSKLPQMGFKVIRDGDGEMVVMDPSLIEMVSKNGKPVSPSPRHGSGEGTQAATGEGGGLNPDEVKFSRIPSPIAVPARTAALRVTVRRMLNRAAPAIDRARVLFQDRELYIRRQAVERVEAETGMPVPTDLNTYVAASLYPGRAGERLTDLEAKWVDALTEGMQLAKIDTDQLGDYLYARHAEERNEKIAPMYEAGHDFFEAPTNPDIVGGSGMSANEARAILARINGGSQRADYESLARILDAMQAETLDTMLKAGLIDRETYDDWKNQYQNYVPLRGFEVMDEDEASDNVRAGRGFDTKGREAMAALGRHSKADNPVAYAVQQAMQAIIRSEKNRVGKTLLRAIEAYPDESVWKVYKGEARRRINPATGMVETYWVAPAFVRAENIYGVKLGGKQKYVEIKHRGLARALRGQGASELQGTMVGRFFQKTMRIYAQLNTSWNPEFMGPNAFRDLGTAMGNLSDIKDKPPHIRAKIIKEALSLKSIRGIMSALRGEGKSAYAPWFDEYRLAGGKISFVEFNDVARIKANIESAVKGRMWWQALRGFTKLVEDLNTAVENGVRLSTYIALRKGGVSQDRAAFVARELTVNFNRKGELGPALNSMYLFFGASIQGSTRLAQAVYRSRGLRYGLGAIIGAGFALDFLNALLAGDDDDDKNAYDKIEDWVKERNLILMIPGGKPDDRIMIPLPYGYNFPYLMGQQMASAMRGARTPGQAASTVATAFFEAFNPIGSSVSFPQFVAPTLLDPMVQTLENQTWYGGPIYPPKFDQKEPDSEVYFASAPRWARVMARELNEATGGNVGRKGWIDVSPETLEHYAEFIGGGFGRFKTNAIETIQRFWDGDEWLPEETPIIRRFYGKSTTSSKRRDFYDAWNIVDAAHYEVKELSDAKQLEDVKAARIRNATELSVYDTMSGAHKALGVFRKQRDAIRLNDGLTESQKRAKTDELVTRENEVITRAVGAYNAALKRRKDFPAPSKLGGPGYEEKPWYVPGGKRQRRDIYRVPDPHEAIEEEMRELENEMRRLQGKPPVAPFDVPAPDEGDEIG